MNESTLPTGWRRVLAWTRLDLDPAGRIAGWEGIDGGDQDPVALLEDSLVPGPSLGGFFALAHGFSGSYCNHG